MKFKTIKTKTINIILGANFGTEYTAAVFPILWASVCSQSDLCTL